MATKRGADSVVPVLVEPHRPLASHGRRVWDACHASGEVRGNVEPLLMLCERIDERVMLRARVFSSNNPADRAGLRALDTLIDESLERLGLRTILPVGTKVVADDWTVSLAAVRG
jgi:hypothetical protein